MIIIIENLLNKNSLNLSFWPIHTQKYYYCNSLTLFWIRNRSVSGLSLLRSVWLSTCNLTRGGRVWKSCSPLKEQAEMRGARGESGGDGVHGDLRGASSQMKREILAAWAFSSQTVLLSHNSQATESQVDFPGKIIWLLRWNILNYARRACPRCINFYARLEMLIFTHGKNSAWLFRLP